MSQSLVKSFLFNNKAKSHANRQTELAAPLYISS